MTTEALELDCHVQGVEFHNFKNFIAIFKVYFKLKSVNLNTRHLSLLPANSHKTVLQIEDDKPIVFTSKLLTWNGISLSDEIEVQNLVLPTQIEKRDNRSYYRRAEWKAYSMILI